MLYRPTLHYIVKWTWVWFSLKTSFYSFTWLKIQSTTNDGINHSCKYTNYPLNMLNGILSSARAANRQCILYKQSMGYRKLRSPSFKANNCGRYTERIRLSEPRNNQLVAPIQNVQPLHIRNVCCSSFRKWWWTELDRIGPTRGWIHCVPKHKLTSISYLTLIHNLRQCFNYMPLP